MQQDKIRIYVFLVLKIIISVTWRY